MCKRLFDGFKTLVSEVRDERTWVAFELSRRCSYWTWQSVQKWLTSESLEKHQFDGCAFGLTGKSGQPLLKRWTIATDMGELCCLDGYRCDGTHEHEQSRGKSLKSAENYTYVFTDLVHESFARSALNLRHKRARPARLMAAASQQEAISEEQLEFWHMNYRNLTYSCAYYEADRTTQVSEVVSGFLNDLTPASALARPGPAADKPEQHLHTLVVALQANSFHIYL